MAKSIETAQDVHEWAAEIVAAGGGKFTPLSKGDQFVIAKYIIDVSTDNAQAKPIESIPAETDAQIVSPKGTEPEPVPSTKATMTRGYAYHRAGYTVQQAYDEFLKWGKEHPTETTVMDFSNGQSNKYAAFAYWLNEIIEVEVPHNPAMR